MVNSLDGFRRMWHVMGLEHAQETNAGRVEFPKRSRTIHDLAHDESRMLCPCAVVSIAALRAIIMFQGSPARMLSSVFLLKFMKKYEAHRQYYTLGATNADEKAIRQTKCTICPQIEHGYSHDC